MQFPIALELFPVGGCMKGKHCWRWDLVYSISRINQDIPKRKTVPGPDIHYHTNTLHSSYHTAQLRNEISTIAANNPFRRRQTEKWQTERGKTELILVDHDINYRYFSFCFGGRCPFFLERYNRGRVRKNKTKNNKKGERIERET